MKNYEKYADKIRGYKGTRFCKDFVEPYILKSDKCNGLSCGVCNMLQMIWLLEEYEEPETDWSKVDEQVGLQLMTKMCLLGHTPNWQKVRKSDGSKRICNEKSIG